MAIFLAVLGVLCWLFAGWVLTVSLSDIQIGLFATAAVGGGLFFGLAYVAATTDEILRRLRKS